MQNGRSVNRPKIIGKSSMANTCTCAHKPHIDTHTATHIHINTQRHTHTELVKTWIQQSHISARSMRRWSLTYNKKNHKNDIASCMINKPVKNQQGQGQMNIDINNRTQSNVITRQLISNTDSYHHLSSWIHKETSHDNNLYSTTVSSNDWLADVWQRWLASPSLFSRLETDLTISRLHYITRTSCMATYNLGASVSDIWPVNTNLLYIPVHMYNVLLI